MVLSCPAATVCWVGKEQGASGATSWCLLSSCGPATLRRRHPGGALVRRARAPQHPLAGPGRHRRRQQRRGGGGGGRRGRARRHVWRVRGVPVQLAHLPLQGEEGAGFCCCCHELCASFATHRSAGDPPSSALRRQGGDSCCVPASHPHSLRTPWTVWWTSTRWRRPSATRRAGPRAPPPSATSRRASCAPPRRPAGATGLTHTAWPPCHPSPPPPQKAAHAQPPAPHLQLTQSAAAVAGGGGWC